MHASIPSLRPIVSRCNRDRTSLATPAAFLAPTEPFPPPPSRSIAARAICLRVDEWNYGGLESGSAIKRRIDNLHPLSLFVFPSSNGDRNFIRSGARFRNGKGQLPVGRKGVVKVYW